MVVDSGAHSETRKRLGDNLGEYLHDLGIGKCDIIRAMFGLCLWFLTQTA